MQYIVFDLEFNQDLDSVINPGLVSSDPDPNNLPSKNKYPYEIIQIGAVKLDENFSFTDTFNRYVKPSIYTRISTYITDLTGISTERLQSEESFENVYNDFIGFIDGSESILCTWGVIDIITLHKNIKYHNLNESLLPQKYINIQPYVSVHLGQSKKRLLSLSYCIEALGIANDTPFHNALYDAIYTAEIFKKIYNSAMEPKTYNPSKTVQPGRPVKKVLDFPMLVAQFEKMFSREMTAEEKEIIRLAYHMGKTGQFLKTNDSLHEDG